MSYIIKFHIDSMKIDRIYEAFPSVTSWGRIIERLERWQRALRFGFYNLFSERSGGEVVCVYLICYFRFLLIITSLYCQAMPRLKSVGFSRLKMRCGHDNCSYYGVQYTMKRHTAARHPGRTVKILGCMDNFIQQVRIEMQTNWMNTPDTNWQK